MYKKLADIINGSVENDSICMLVLTGKGDFFSSGNDFSAVMSPDIKNSNQMFKYVRKLDKSNNIIIY